MKDLPKLLEGGSPKDIAMEEELLTKLLLQLDAVTDEKFRDHRKALVESIQHLLHRVDAAKGTRTSE